MHPSNQRNYFYVCFSSPFTVCCPIFTSYTPLHTSLASSRTLVPTITIPSSLYYYYCMYRVFGCIWVHARAVSCWARFFFPTVDERRQKSIHWLVDIKTWRHARNDGREASRRMGWRWFDCLTACQHTSTHQHSTGFNAERVKTLMRNEVHYARARASTRTDKFYMDG